MNNGFMPKLIAAALVLACNFSANVNATQDSGIYIKAFGQGSEIFKNEIEYNSAGVLGIYNHYNYDPADIDKKPNLPLYSAEYKKAFGGGMGIGYNAGFFSADLEAVASNANGIEPDGYQVLDASGEYVGVLGPYDENKDVGLNKDSNYIHSYTEKSGIANQEGDWSGWEGASLVYENKGFSYFAGIVNAYLNPKIWNFSPYIGVGAGFAKLRYDEDSSSNALALQGKAGISFKLKRIEPYIGYKVMQLTEKKNRNLKSIGYVTTGSKISTESQSISGLNLKNRYLIHNIEAGLRFTLS